MRFSFLIDFKTFSNICNEKYIVEIYYKSLRKIQNLNEDSNTIDDIYFFN